MAARQLSKQALPAARHSSTASRSTALLAATLSQRAAGAARDASTSARSDALLDAALPLIAEHGFSEDAIRAGTPDIPFPTLRALYPPQGALGGSVSGPAQALLQHWLADAARRSAQAAVDQQLEGAEAVRVTLRTRLAINADPELRPLIAPALRTLLLRADPSLLAAHWSAVANDACWAAYPDGGQGVRRRSECEPLIAQTLWYARRARIAAIYGAVEAFQWRDDSLDDRATLAMLDRLLDRSETVVRAVDETLAFGGHVLDTWRGLYRSRGF